MPLLTQIQRFRKIRHKEQFLKQLVSVYANPWSKVRASLRDHGLDPSAERARASEQLFREDCEALASVRSLPAREAVIAILDRLLMSLLVPQFYERDYLDDLIPILSSRYVSEQGNPLADYAGHWITTLWGLCGETGVPDESLLPSQLKTLWPAGDHPYRPQIKPLGEEVRSLSPALAGELETVRGSEDPAKLAAICGRLFKRVNAKVNTRFETRDISLVYGYENNHHLLLRSIIDLMSAGKLTADDPVLILGPRYPDEVHFFRKYLGLKNTIGLDLLQYQPDVILQGDMHQMPFEDGRFKLVYGANVFEYAYDLRQVVCEIARVTQRPGYVAAVLRSMPSVHPNALGRSDVPGIDAATRLFYETPHTILAQDAGLTASPEEIGIFPCFLLRLNEATTLPA